MQNNDEVPVVDKEDALSVLKLAGWAFQYRRGGFVAFKAPHDQIYLWDERGWRNALEQAWQRHFKTKIQVKV